MAADWGGGWTAKQTIVFTLSKGIRPYMEAMRWNQVARWQYIGQQVRRTCAAQHLRRSYEYGSTETPLHRRRFQCTWSRSSTASRSTMRSPMAMSGW